MLYSSQVQFQVLILRKITVYYCSCLSPVFFDQFSQGKGVPNDVLIKPNGNRWWGGHRILDRADGTQDPIQSSQRLEKRYCPPCFVHLWALSHNSTFHSQNTLPFEFLCSITFWNTSRLAIGTRIDPPKFFCVHSYSSAWQRQEPHSGI